jgi:hypothetical protein
VCFPNGPWQVVLPFNPPHDVVMVMGRRSGADSKPRQPGAPMKVDLGIRSDEMYISRQAVSFRMNSR